MVIYVGYASGEILKEFNSFEEISNYDKVALLNCSHNQLNSLPQLPKSLVRLRCSHNQLNSLPELPKSLISLSCENNQLNSLPELPNSLVYIDCGNNQLSSFPQLSTSLTRLYCSHNQLNSLPQLPNSLNILNCEYNKLNSLPQLPNSLQFLFHRNNQFATHQENYLQKMIYCMSQCKQMFLHNLFDFFGEKCLYCKYSFVNIDKYIFTEYENKDIVIQNSSCRVCSEN